MSEPAYVCMECARTTSGRCVQHSYVSIPKQDILSGKYVGSAEQDSERDNENAALRKRVEELSTPLCVGRGTLSILAETGQYLADDGRSLIAADDLFKADPWLRAEKAEAERNTLLYSIPTRVRDATADLIEKLEKAERERDEWRAQAVEAHDHTIPEHERALACALPIWEEALKLSRDRAEKAERERDAFVKVLDPENCNVVGAMANAQSLAALLAESEGENRLRIAVNESCSCGGREPGPEACPACMVWHRMNDGADCEAKAKLPLGHEFVPCEVAGRMFGMCSRTGVGACMWGEGKDGKPPTRYESLCHYQGCGRTAAEHCGQHDEIEAKLPLPLGHPYLHTNDLDLCGAISIVDDEPCGQPRSAHEPK